MEEPASELALISAAIDRAGSVPVTCWRREEIAEWLCGLQGMRARFDALCVEAASVADAAGVPSLEPATRTLRQFVAARTNGNGVDVGVDLRLAQWLSRFPAVAEAWRAGRITRRHVDAIRALENPRTALAVRQHQEALVEAATSCSWDGFGEVCGRVLVYTDPDGSLHDERVRRRGVSIRTRNDGTVTGTFCFEPTSGSAAKSALEREFRRLWDLDADPSHPDATMRDPKQRMADALANLITRGALRPDGTVGSPLIHVVVGQAVLEEAICRAVAARGGVLPVGPDGRVLDDDLGVDPGDPLRRCELVDGTALHPTSVIGLLGVATLRRVVLGAKSEVLDLGRSTRSFPRQLKEAMLTAGRGRCGTTGCDATLSWLEADHILPWGRGGPTATHNGQIRCAADNRAKGDRLPPPDPVDPPEAFVMPSRTIQREPTRCSADWADNGSTP